jgi:hypothetical protein
VHERKDNTVRSNGLVQVARLNPKQPRGQGAAGGKRNGPLGSKVGTCEEAHYISWRLTSSTVDEQNSGTITCEVADMPIVPRFGSDDGD